MNYNNDMMGREHRRQGTTAAPIGLRPGKTIPITEGCRCYTAGNNGETTRDIDFDDLELLILRCDTCVWIYDPIEETLFDR